LSAGKQLEQLLNERSVDTDFKTMSDASASNFPTLKDNLLARWIITLCMSHARRRFVELIDDSDDKDVRFIIDIIAKVYGNEKHCKKEKLDDQERLVYHQKHSEPLMSALRVWMSNLFLYKLVEPNSQFGTSINYMLKRWEWLTHFLRVPGAAIDNNICEQAIKVAIRYRKNSLFFKTFYGANIGDAIMGVAHTASHASINTFDYFNALQEYESYVQETPEEWLPWNYEQTCASIDEMESPVAINSS